MNLPPVLSHAVRVLYRQMQIRSLMVKPVTLAEYDPDIVRDAKTPLLYFATVGTFNQKDKEHGGRLIFETDIEDTATDSVWQSLKNRLADGGQRRPLLVVYDEAQNLSDQQTNLLLELQPDAFIVASATCLVGRHRLEQRLDRAPHRPPGRTELPGQASHACMLASELTDRPPTRPRGQQRTRPGHVLVLLGERFLRAGGLNAPPGPLTPHQLHRPGEAGHVDKMDVAAAAAGHEHTTRRAAHRLGRGLDHNPKVAVAFGDLNDVEPRQPDEQITPLAVRGVAGGIWT